MSHLIDFLAKVAALKTGEEQDGHASGADTIAILDQLITDARVQLVASREAHPVSPAGVELISSMRDLMDGAAGILPPDCEFDVAIKAADTFLKTRREADKICPDGVALIRGMGELIDEAISTHIYMSQDEIADDCPYHGAVAAADLYVKAHEQLAAG